MKLIFLYPYFLFGLAAGIVPILIHRLTKRRALTKPFSAVRLLLQSQRVLARPQRLKHLLLLALRILTVIGLALLMAQPIAVREGLLALGNEAAKVIILDNSLSMGYQEENGKRFELAKKTVREMIEGLKGQVMIIPTSTVKSNPIQESDLHWMFPQDALKELASLPLSIGQGEPGTALRLGVLKLKEIKTPGEILVISDMARGDWERLDVSQLGVVPSEVRIAFLQMGGPKRDSNFAIKGAKLSEGEALVGVPCRLEVTVSNLSDQSGTVLSQLFLSQVKKDQKSIEIKAGEEGKVYFELSLDQSGWVDGEVRISNDRLSTDDLFFFSMKVREKIKVLVADGDPKTSLRASESYYLVNALLPGGSEMSPFLTHVVTEEEFAFLDVKPFEAIFLLNMARLQPSKLFSILESGKPVFIFLGDRVISEEYNRLPLSRWRIREAENREPVRIAHIDQSRPILKSLSHEGAESLKGALFRRYFKVEGAMRKLLAFENNDPFLSEMDLGKGKIFLFASSADLDWNDLPMKAAYLPLVQGMLKDGVALQRDSILESIRLGGSLGESVHPNRMGEPEWGAGIYPFQTSNGEKRRGVNPSFEESDLSKVTREEMKKRFGKIETKMVEYKEGVLKEIHGSRKEIWPFLLAAVLIFLVIEMGVANRI